MSSPSFCFSNFIKKFLTSNFLLNNKIISTEKIKISQIMKLAYKFNKKTTANSPISIFILVRFFPRIHDFDPFLYFRSKHFRGNKIDGSHARQPYNGKNLIVMITLLLKKGLRRNFMTFLCQYSPLLNLINFIFLINLKMLSQHNIFWRLLQFNCLVYYMAP